MTELDCESCGEHFDTERETVTPGQNTRRCPSCGAVNDPPEPDGGEVLDVAADEGAVRLEVHVHVHRHA